MRKRISHIMNALTFGLVMVGMLFCAFLPLATTNASAASGTASGYAWGTNVLGMTVYELWVTEGFSYDGSKVTWYQEPPTVTAKALPGSTPFDTEGYTNVIWHENGMDKCVLAYGHSKYGFPSPWGYVTTGALHMGDYCYYDGSIYYSGGAGY